MARPDEKHCSDETFLFEQCFAEFDLDLSGDLDKQEMHAALKRLGFSVSQQQLNVLWPLFHLEINGKIGASNWAQVGG